jgi:hypothetical protein
MSQSIQKYRTTLGAGRPKICASITGGVNKYLSSVNLPDGHVRTQFHRYFCFLCIYFQKAKIQEPKASIQSNITCSVQAVRCKGTSNWDIAFFVLRRNKLTYFYSHDCSGKNKEVVMLPSDTSFSFYA